jgi:hypothetical protein
MALILGCNRLKKLLSLNYFSVRLIPLVERVFEFVVFAVKFDVATAVPVMCLKTVWVELSFTDRTALVFV